MKYGKEGTIHSMQIVTNIIDCTGQIEHVLLEHLKRCETQICQKGYKVLQKITRHLTRDPGRILRPFRYVSASREIYTKEVHVGIEPA